MTKGSSGFCASGHIYGLGMDEMAKTIRPEILIPVHTEDRDFFRRFEGICRVVWPKRGKPVPVAKNSNWVIPVSRLSKIYRKSSAWWKHGRRKGSAQVAAHFNRLAGKRRKRVDLEPLDLSRPDWSRRSRR